MRIEEFWTLPVLSAPTTAPRSVQPSGFLDMLRQVMGDANSAQIKAEDLQAREAAGEELPPELVPMSIIKAELAFSALVQIRNKLIEAYQELRQMQV